MKIFEIGGRKRRRKTGRFTKHNKKICLAINPSESEEIETNRDEENTAESWRHGRRIVELGLLADELEKGCTECKEPLKLSNTESETRLGLGSTLYISCKKCGQLCSIRTGKTHRDPGKKKVGSPIWDINTKAATGW